MSIAKQNGAGARGDWISIAAPVVLFLIALIVFTPAMNAGFVDLDDFELLINNDKWRGLGAPQIRWMFSTTMFGHYQPLTWLSYALNFEMDGMEGMKDPVGYHLMNILLHATSAVLVYLVGLRLFRAAGASPGANVLTPVQERLGAGIGAILWAAHPLRAESVAWVTERRDVLSTVFLLGALLACLKAAGLSSDDRKPWPRLYATSIVLFVLSLLSKSWGMSFFVILLVLDWYPLRRLPAQPWKWVSRSCLPVLAEKMPFFVIGIACAAMAGLAQKSAEGGAMRTLADWPLENRIAQAAHGLVFYFWKSVAPGGLAPLYELPLGMNPFAPKYLLCYGLVAAAAVVVIVCARRAPAITVAAVIYAVLLAPILGFFQSGDQFVADRYSYVATIGLSLLVGGGVAHAVRWAKASGRLNPGLITAGTTVILLALGVLTMNQAAVWRDSLALWEHAVKAGVTTPAVRVNYGLNLEREGRPDEAVEQFRLATQDRPQDGRGWNVMANTLKKMKRFDEADKAYAEAEKFLPQKYMALMNHGQMLLRMPGREIDGLQKLRDAVADVERPGAGGGRRVSGVPYLVLGSILWNRGEHDEAKVLLRKGLEFPDSREDAAKQLRAIGEKP